MSWVVWFAGFAWFFWFAGFDWSVWFVRVSLLFSLMAACVAGPCLVESLVACGGTVTDGDNGYCYAAEWAYEYMRGTCTAVQCCTLRYMANT